MGATKPMRDWVVERLELLRRRPGSVDLALWERTRAAVEDLLPGIVARVTPGSKAQ